MYTDVIIDPTDRSATEVVEAARLAEQVGFDGVWTYDHLSGVTLDGESVHDVWTLLGAIAGATDRVTVGPLVANVTTRHPAALAVAAATLQELSHGRAMLGIGAGAGPGSPYAREMLMVGMEPRPAAERRAMVAEAVGLIGNLWAGESDFVGEHFQLSGATGFGRPDPVPPIIVGCNGPKLCGVGAAVADGVNVHSTEEDLAGLIRHALEAAAGRKLIITVEAPLTDDWLASDRSSRANLVELGVDRVMCRWRAENTLDDLRAGGALLAR